MLLRKVMVAGSGRADGIDLTQRKIAKWPDDHGDRRTIVETCLMGSK